MSEVRLAAAQPDLDAAVRGRFPTRYVVTAGANGCGRFEVHDPASGRAWALGATELRLARRFDGVNTYRDIAAGLDRPVSPEKLRAFETTLLNVGVLERAAPRSSRLAWIRWLDKCDVGSVDPTRVLDRVHRAAAWLFRPPAMAVATILSLVVLAGLVPRFDEFLGAVLEAVRGWGVLYLYLTCAASVVFHEGGHALACRAYGVPVRRIGIGLRSLLVFAWTEPDRHAWSRLPRRLRMVTIAAGPLGSLVSAAFGAGCWLAPAPAPVRTAGVLLVLAGTVCVLPTLLPIYDGDMYLLITDLAGLPGLRSRSMYELRRLRGADGPVRGRLDPARLGYLAFALVTTVGRVAVGAVVGSLILACALLSG